jgi:hypothetical protein
MTATLEGFAPAEGQERIVPTPEEEALGSMVNNALVGAPDITGDAGLAAAQAAETSVASEERSQPKKTLPVTEAYEPVDDRFRTSSWASMTPRERLAAALEREVVGSVSDERLGLMSTYRARQLRGEAAGIRNPVARHAFLRQAGLGY